MPYRVKKGLISQTVDGELLILNREQEKIHQLNPIASFIWQRLDGQVSIDQIVTAITERYDVKEEVAKRDLESLVNELSDLKLIEVV